MDVVVVSVAVDPSNELLERVDIGDVSSVQVASTTPLATIAPQYGKVELLGRMVNSGVYVMDSDLTYPQYANPESDTHASSQPWA
ncbi:hypothetical protein LTR95_009960 [Oleoguttula sp. CCFEE 5521]